MTPQAVGREGPPSPGGLPDSAAVLARAREENFPVASRLLPRAARRHLLALYGFARLADHLGDEAAGDRRALLDWLEEELDLLYGGEVRHPLMQPLALTVRACGLPREPLQRLIEANRQDQRVHRYETFEDLLDYCALSANPVGHLVLHVFGLATDERMELSDAICTGLQLAEHWQDVAEDARADRIYIPREDLSRFGCSERDLRAPRANDSVRALIRFEVTRARERLERGRALVATVSGRPRLAIAGFAAGGHAALDAIERQQFDVLKATARPRRRDFLYRFVEVLRRSGGRGRSPLHAPGGAR